MTETAQPKKSDLGVRVLSAIVMVAVAGAALWLGGWIWTAFVALVALGVLWEWWGLVRGFVPSVTGRTLWLFGGLAYVGLAAGILVYFRDEPTSGWQMLLMVLFGVIGTDVGAYLLGRTIGGPKIAPAVSPSKTWAGLGGGMIGASIGVCGAIWLSQSQPFERAVLSALAVDPRTVTTVASDGPFLLRILILSIMLAIVAQSGDFFESWMKRRAGVKDSGHLIPGHGGVFDRTDGLIAVLFVLGLYAFFVVVTTV